MMIMMFLTDIATIPFSTARAKNERGGGGKIAERGKPANQGDYHGYHDHYDHPNIYDDLMV